ncbi:MAG TPA: S8 family serine peptidase [Solirubrobacteraceae bacterium]|nr:S8 family serine peptidase [Solirubrobacteraceae bacterium]
MTGRRVIALALASLAVAPATAAAAGDPLRSQQWNLDAINADEAHRISTGTGALVAVVDSGVQASHPDLAGKVVEGPDFIENDPTPNDEHGHGTNVAGIIAANSGNGIGIEGAAPGAKVLAIRVLDEHNRGYTDQEASGIDAAVAAGAQVINLSLSAGPNVVTTLLPGDALVQAIERAARAGVVIVAAAGNDGVPLCAQPLLATKILCVGAVNRARRRASYTNYAVRVDMVAPGGETQVDEGIEGPQLGGGYSAMAGTSQATPHVAAAAALLVALGLRGGAVIDRLEQTATSLGSAPQLGHGLLNMSAAVAGLGPPLPSSTPPASSRRCPRTPPSRCGLPPCDADLPTPPTHGPGGRHAPSARAARHRTPAGARSASPCAACRSWAIVLVLSWAMRRRPPPRRARSAARRGPIACRAASSPTAHAAWRATTCCSASLAMTG